MKKIILFIAVATLSSCAKYKTEHHIVGTWKMSEAKINGSDSWGAIGNEIDAVIITKTFITQPWSNTYELIDENTIKINNEDIDVIFEDRNHMMFCDSNDSLKFIRQ